MNNTHSHTRSQRIGDVAGAILVGVSLVGVVSLFALFPGAASIVAPFIKKKKYPKKQTIEKSVESLRKAGLIKKTVGADGHIHIELTTRGKWHALLRSRAHDTRIQQWDKIWRIVIFDVPVSKNKLRSELRGAMLMYGFKMLQQSVWVYPYPCDDFIAVLKSHLGVSGDVLYMKVSYIENDTRLRKEFGLH